MSDRPPNYALIALTALVALLVGGALLWAQFGPKTERAGGAPGLAIVTDDMLNALAAQEERDRDRDALGTDLSTIETAYKQREAAGQTRAPAGGNQPAAPAATEKKSLGAAAMRSMISDEMEARLNGHLTESRRFAVAEQRRIVQFLKGTEPQAVKDAAKSAEAPQTQDVQKAVQSTFISIAGAPPKVETLGQIARDSGVRYLLFVALQEPRTTWQFVFSDEGNLVLQYEADPVFIYRLYDTASGSPVSVLSRVAQLDQPEVVNVPLSTYSGRDITGSFRADGERALRELYQSFRRKIAAKISTEVIDEVFPGRIVEVNPLTINRGGNDGYAVGDTVQLLRVGAAINDKDQDGREIAIDAPKTPVGSARVIAVGENTATIEVNGGAAVEKGLIVRRGESAGGASAASSGGGLGLGETGMAVAQNEGSGALINRQKIAVGDFRVSSDGQRFANVPFRSGLETRLAGEPRLQLLSRDNLAALRRERNVDSGRRSYSATQSGVTEAAYLVLGNVVVDTQRSAQTLAVAGAPTRETSVSWALVAKGALRIERLDSTLEQAFDVTARTPISSAAAATDAASLQALSQAFATEASRAIMLRLFPMRIVEDRGGVFILGRGADVGLKVGDRLQAFEVGKPVIDPGTSTVLSAGARTPRGFLEVTSVEPTISYVRSLGEGYVPAVGHLVERAPAVAPAPAAQPRPAARPKQSQSQPKETATPW